MNFNKKNFEDTTIKSLMVLCIILLSMFLFSLTANSQSKCEVDSVIKSYNIKYADIVLKQSILETGWYKSYSCRKRHNLFGFRYKGEYLSFDTWEESVAYYARWQARHFDDECCDDYYDFLVRRGYAEDKEYINKLKSIKI
jgi:flagellum-specific peptidoglycan hydrolase FlgJ